MPQRTGQRGLRIVGLIGVVALGVWAYSALVHPNVSPKRFHTVDEGAIYRSGKLTPGALDKVVREHGIKTIVDLGAWEEGSPEDRLEQSTAESLGATRYRFSLIGDATGNPNHYLNALRLITDPENQPVLLHCGAGTERTGAAIAMYRRHMQGVPMDEALEEARRIGHSPDRNPHLIEMLDRWSDEIGRALEAGDAVRGAEPVPAPEPVVSPE